MTKYQFEKEIQNRIETDTDKKIDINDIKKIIEQSEDLIMELIATGDSVRFSWGTIGGMNREPVKLKGMAEKTFADPYKYSFCRVGYPYCKFTRPARFCTLVPASEWFSDARNQYGKSWENYKKEIDEDYGGERFKKFAGMYGLRREERKELIPKLEKEYKEMVNAPDYKKPEDKFTIDELKKIPIWAEGSERKI